MTSLKEGGGIVAGFFTVTRNLKFRIRVGPAQRVESVSFSAKYGRLFTSSVYHKLIHLSFRLERTVGNDFRIVQLYITTVNKAAPIHLQWHSGSNSTHAAGGEEEASINPALLGREG